VATLSFFGTIVTVGGRVPKAVKTGVSAANIRRYISRGRVN
jgi:hypothetical protein